MIHRLIDKFIYTSSQEKGGVMVDWEECKTNDRFFYSSNCHTVNCHVDTPEQIAAFRPTLEMQERLRSLLAKSKGGDLTPDERRELDECERVEHLIIMLKLGNAPYLNHQPSS